MNPEKTIIELNGVKLEVDLRHAKRIDTLRVGDKVKLLEKTQYSDNSVKVHNGVIAGFEPFPSAPTIIVAYVEMGYKSAELKFAYLRAGDEDSKKFEIVPSIDDDMPLDQAFVTECFDVEITRRKQEIEDFERKKAYFLSNFKKYFPVADSQAEAA